MTKRKYIVFPELPTALCSTQFYLEKLASTVAHDHFKCVFWNKNNEIPIRISFHLNLFPAKGHIDNKASLVQVMAWRRTGGKSLPEPMLVHFTDLYMRH